MVEKDLEQVGGTGDRLFLQANSMSCSRHASWRHLARLRLGSVKIWELGGRDTLVKRAHRVGAKGAPASLSSLLGGQAGQWTAAEWSARLHGWGKRRAERAATGSERERDSGGPRLSSEEEEERQG
nr:unnamed protein product [Digitaria exilis]